MRQPLTREAIAQAARDILVAEGLHSVSLRRVAARLGVTAPALYAHVADKRDLLQGIVEQEVESLLRRFDEVGGDDPTDRVRRICHAYVDYAMQSPDLFRAMFLFQPELTAEPRGDQVPLAAKLIEALSQAVRAGNGSIGGGGDPAFVALTIWAAVHGAVVLLLAGPAVDVELRGQLPESVIEGILAGVRSRQHMAASA